MLAIAAGTDQNSLRLAGLVALADPPRADSVLLVAGLKDLGVRVLMVTGDNLATACAVAERVGIGSRAATADALDGLDADHALEHDVYARVFPEHKIKLVRLLQTAGHVVGMTGDGVNDAPALKQADVGIAVASATDVARAAAGVVLTAPGLVDVLSAVKISRRIYQRMLTYTINKIMKTLEIAVFLSIGVMLTRAFVITPLLIVLLLFTNDFVTMSIATDRVSYSRTPDRWNINTLMATGGALAALVLLLSFTVFFVGRDLLGLPLPQLQTLVFVMLGGDRTRQCLSDPRAWTFLALAPRSVAGRQFGRRPRRGGANVDSRRVNGTGEPLLINRIVGFRCNLFDRPRSVQSTHLPALQNSVMPRNWGNLCPSTDAPLSCRAFGLGKWHIADIKSTPIDLCYLDKSGHRSNANACRTLTTRGITGICSLKLAGKLHNSNDNASNNCDST